MPRHSLCAGRGSIPACLLGQHSASHTCPQPVAAGLRGFGAQVMAGIRVLLFNGTRCQFSQLPPNSARMVTVVGYLLTLPYPYDQAHSQFFKAGCAADLHAYFQGAGLCLSPWPQGSPPQGIRSLISCVPQHRFCHQGSAPFLTRHLPQLPSTPCDHEEVLTDPRPERWDTGTLLTHPGACHCCHLT